MSDPQPSNRPPPPRPPLRRRTSAPAVPAVSPYAPADVIASKYQLTSMLGEGSMGSVWLARNLTLNVDVAIKLVRADLSGKESSERLLREARAAAQLKHPSIVRIHDFGQTRQGDPFIVMELLDGASLGALIESRGGISTSYAVQMVLPICGALHEAHQADTVHRDVKPDNIILVAERETSVVPKLVDFGIAKIEAEPLSQGRKWPESESSAPNLTVMGSLIGSPAYMSPEQARGAHDVDGRADLWALSVVLYEAIAGYRPFPQEDTEALLMAILTQDPPRLPARVGCDAVLWEIITRGLCRKREERWPSAREMGRALARWLVTQGVETDVTGASVRQHWLPDEPVSGVGLVAPPAGGSIPPRSPSIPPLRSSSPSFSSPGMMVPSGALAPPPVSLPLPAHEPPRRRALMFVMVGAGLMVAAVIFGLAMIDDEPAAMPSATANSAQTAEALASGTAAESASPDASATPSASVDAAGDLGHATTATPSPARTQWRRPYRPVPRRPVSPRPTNAPRPAPTKDLGF